MDSEGSRRLIRAAAARGAECVRGLPMPDHGRALRRRIAIENGHVAHFGIEVRPWTAEELALLGTDYDRAIAARIGRAEDTVQKMRKSMGIPSKLARRDKTRHTMPG